MTPHSLSNSFAPSHNCIQHPAPSLCVPNKRPTFVTPVSGSVFCVAPAPCLASTSNPRLFSSHSTMTPPINSPLLHDPDPILPRASIKEMEMKRQLPFPNELNSDHGSSTPQFPFDLVPRTTFASNASAAFVFSGHHESNRKRKSLEKSGVSNHKKMCPEAKMVANMSRLSLSPQPWACRESQCESAEDEDDEDEEDPFDCHQENNFDNPSICVASEVQLALRGNDILPKEILNKLNPQKSGMEVVLWRPPGTIVPPEIMSSINKSGTNTPDQPGETPASPTDEVPLTFDPKTLLLKKIRDRHKADMEMDTV